MKLKDELIFENVVAGQNAYCMMPLGNRVQMIVLEIGSTNDDAFDAIVGDILLKVDDGVQRTMSARELDDLNKANGPKYAARIVNVAAAGGDRTYLPIYFWKPWSKNSGDQEIPAWTTDWMKKFQVLVAIKAGIVGPILNAYYVFDEVTSGGKGQLIEKWIRSDIPAVGSVIESDNAIERKDLITQISLYDPAGATPGVITRATLKAGGKTLIYQTRQRIASELQQFAEMDPAIPAENTAGRLDLVFDSDGLTKSALPAAAFNALRLRLEFAAATNGSIRAITQRFGTPE